MKKLESSLKNMLLCLAVITIVSGGLLALVNEKTQGPIEEANKQTLQAGLKEVIPDFDNNPAEDTASVVINGQTYIVYKAYKGGQSAGAAVESSAGGFGGDLKVLVGFDNDGKITNYRLLAHSETPGLGSKADTWFKKGGKGDITGMSPADGPLTVSKDGGQIDAITASTITSRAFLNAVNSAYAAYMQQAGQSVPADAVSGASIKSDN